MIRFAPAIAALQDGVKIDITTSDPNAVWYTDPVWLAIGGLALLIVIVLIIMASRKSSSTTTTIQQ